LLSAPSAASPQSPIHFFFCSGSRPLGEFRLTLRKTGSPPPGKPQSPASAPAEPPVRNYPKSPLRGTRPPCLFEITALHQNLPSNPTPYLSGQPEKCRPPCHHPPPFAGADVPPFRPNQKHPAKFRISSSPHSTKQKKIERAAKSPCQPCLMRQWLRLVRRQARSCNTHPLPLGASPTPLLLAASARRRNLSKKIQMWPRQRPCGSRLGSPPRALGFPVPALSPASRPFIPARPPPLFSVPPPRP